MPTPYRRSRYNLPQPQYTIGTNLGARGGGRRHSRGHPNPLFVGSLNTKCIAIMSINNIFYQVSSYIEYECSAL